jgi:7,8-dihydro-6-hydroxymethylpterin-pyrophosphokinase
MLRPMAELAPECRHPIVGRTLRELWQAFDNGDNSHDMELVTIDW